MNIHLIALLSWRPVVCNHQVNFRKRWSNLWIDCK